MKMEKVMKLDKNESGLEFVTLRSYLLNGELHNFNNEPALTSYYENGEIRGVSYYLNGKPDRKDLNEPISIRYYQKKGIKKEEYLLDKNNTKTITRDKNNEITLIEYRDENGHFHRDKFEPSVISYKNGKIVEEFYHVNGEYLDYKVGPASIKYNKDGLIEEKKYHRVSYKVDEFNFLSENIDLLYKVEIYDENERMVEEIYRINGVPCSKQEFLNKI